MKKIIFILISIFAIFVQLSNPVTVHADDGQPPAEATEIPATEPPVEIETTPEPILPVENSALDSAPAEDAAPVENPASEESTVAAIMQEIPADTGVVALDESGQAVPLTTQEAATIIANGDPMWCPDTAVTVTAECVSDTTVAGLLIKLATKNANGTIYFYTPTTYNTNDVIFDGTNSNIDQLADNNLTLQGGWDGNTTLSSTISLSGSSDFSAPISIINWTGAVTINDINITASNGTGLNISTTDNITLNNINSNDNAGIGANLDNSSGTGDVIINGTNTFNGNGLDGLDISSSGNITLNNITASGNKGNSGVGDGLWIDNTSGFGDVVLTGTNIFTGNRNQGLSISSNGNIILENVRATNNDGPGANLSNNSNPWKPIANEGESFTLATQQWVAYGYGNSWISIWVSGAVECTSDFFGWDPAPGVAKTCEIWNAGDVVVTGANDFSNNGLAQSSDRLDGLVVISAGNIVLENITANDNHGLGVWLQNTDGIGDVVLMGTNTFNNNLLDGLDVFSAGTVWLNNITASNNQGTGIWGDGVWVNTLSGSGSVNLYGKNTFENNNLDGMEIYSGGDIILNGVTAKNNGRNGLLLFTPGNAMINTFRGITGFGMDASSVCGILVLNNFLGTYDPPITGLHSYTNPNTGQVTTINCTPQVYKDGVLVGSGAMQLVSVFGSQAQFLLSCTNRDSFFVRLPNGDQIQIFCKVSGFAVIKRLGNTMLPAEPPAGYSYVSAFSLEIIQAQGPIPVLNEGGHIRTSFKLPSAKVGSKYAILYWDNGQWRPLKNLIVNEKGAPQSFKLDSGREVLSGVNLVLSGRSPHVEVSTNFPGIFMLAQY